MTRRSLSSISARAGITILIFASAAASQLYNDGSVEVHDIAPIKARSHEPADVLIAAVDTVFHDQQVCCGKNSALIDSLEKADPVSLKSVAERLQGRHLYSDGRPLHITAECVMPAAVSPGQVVSMIASQHPPLMRWNSHLYVVYGVDYRRTEDTSTGARSLILLKFLLWDLRYSDARRNVVFDRETEDPAKVQGLLFISTTSDSRS